MTVAVRATYGCYDTCNNDPWRVLWVLAHGVPLGGIKEESCEAPSRKCVSVSHENQCMHVNGI